MRLHRCLIASKILKFPDNQQNINMQAWLVSQQSLGWSSALQILPVY